MSKKGQYVPLECSANSGAFLSSSGICVRFSCYVVFLIIH